MSKAQYKTVKTMVWKRLVTFYVIIGENSLGKVKIWILNCELHVSKDDYDILWHCTWCCSYNYRKTNNDKNNTLESLERVISTT